MIDKPAVAPVRARDGWFTSSFTNGSQTCVEVKFDIDTILVRDTKHRPPMISVGPSAWTALLSRVTRSQ